MQHTNMACTHVCSHVYRSLLTFSFWRNVKRNLNTPKHTLITPGAAQASRIHTFASKIYHCIKNIFFDANIFFVGLLHQSPHVSTRLHQKIYFWCKRPTYIKTHVDQPWRSTSISVDLSAYMYTQHTTHTHTPTQPLTLSDVAQASLLTCPHHEYVQRDLYTSKQHVKRDLNTFKA